MNKFSNKWIKPYFNFAKKDRNGIIVLTILIFIGILINVIIDFFPKKDDSDYTKFIEALNKWENSERNDSDLRKTLFVFNPNTISNSLLDSLMLPENIKKNLVSYRKAGGKIRNASELKKIYGMNDSIFTEIEDYIVIPVETELTENRNIQKTDVKESNESSEEKNKQHRQSLGTNQLVVELNQADSTALVQLKGIGPVFASRIIKYRNLLGGFYSKKQLLEVYNFPQETFENIEDEITVNASEIQKIRLNFFDYSELLRHPYLNKKQVQTIINYRINNGALNSVEDLDDLNLVDSITYQKILPYLSTR